LARLAQLQTKSDLFTPTYLSTQKTNIYAGIGGTGASDGTTSVSGGGILQAGAETEISKNVVLFGDGSFGDGYSAFKVGAGYSF
jgi:hypothetical protein